jgi:Sortase and related acyltransferases
MYMPEITLRSATSDDLEAILHIYNQGIDDRIATLEVELKDLDYMTSWLNSRGERYTVLIAMINESVVGWASLNRYSLRAVYDGVADLSIYIERSHRGRGIGQKLLQALELIAIQNGFHKIVLFTFPFNEQGQGLYRKSGFREVGVFHEQGILDDKLVDVMAMEKLLL